VQTAIIAALVIALIIVITGLLVIGRWVWEVVTAHLPHPNFAFITEFFTYEDRGIRHFSAEKIGIAATALFTAWLAWLTRPVGLASLRQAAGDAPLLKLDLSIDSIPDSAQPPKQPQIKVLAMDWPRLDPREGRELYQDYRDELRREDREVFDGPHFKVLAPERFIRLRIHNVQAKHFAIARDIKIFLELAYSVTIRLEESSHSEVHMVTEPLARRAEVRVLAPDEASTQPVYNVAALTACRVEVVGVEYRDLRGRRKRRGAYGKVDLNLDANGTVTLRDGYSNPRGWEMP
jgi:hypothetical protein